MVKRLISLVLAILLFSISMSQGAGAQSEPEEVEITVWYTDPDHFDIAPGQVAVIRAGWAACTPGLVRAFIEASDFEAILYDDAGQQVIGLTSEDIDRLWGPVVPSPGVQASCQGNQEPDSAERRYVLRDLPPGTYTLHSSLRMKHPLIDGGDYDGDGRPDRFYPQDLDFDNVHTITVST
jgi:hypothetical protein